MGDQLDRLAIISSKRDVIIKGDRLYRMAISRTRQDKINKGNEQDRAVIINNYAIHTCCKLAGHLKEVLVMRMRTNMTTLTWSLADATSANRSFLFLVGEGHH